MRLNKKNILFLKIFSELRLIYLIDSKSLFEILELILFLYSDNFNFAEPP